METLETRLKRVLESSLRDGQADLETLSNGHVAGDIVSSEFEDLDYEQRRRRVWRVIEAAPDLNSDDRLKISTLLTYTPAEWSASLESI